MSNAPENSKELNKFDSSLPPYDQELTFGPILKSMLALTIMSALAFVSMWWMMMIFKGAEEARDPAPSAFQKEFEAFEPPGPQLQEFPPTEDITAFREWEDSMLETWTMLDEEAGIARIPIDKAIELMAERGLPVQSGVDEIQEELFGDTATAASESEVPESLVTLGDGAVDGNH